MARVYGIKKGLAQNNVDEKRIKEIIGNENLTGVIVRMEKLLDPGMMHEILDACACGGGKEFIKSCEKTGKEIADKTLSEKINHINSISPESDNIVLNDDNTLTVTWSFGDKGKNKCLCSAALTKGESLCACLGEQRHRRLRHAAVLLLMLRGGRTPPFAVAAWRRVKNKGNPIFANQQQGFEAMPICLRDW